MQKRPSLPWPLSPQIEQRLGSSYGAQRTLSADGQLLLILHAPPLPGQTREHAVFLRLPRAGQVGGQWWVDGQEGGLPALTQLLDRYAQQLEHLENILDTAQSTRELFDLIGPCMPLARAAANMQAALQAAREAAPEDPALIDQRDRAVELARSFELLLADARMALDYRMAEAAEAQARATQEVTLAQRKLNVIASLTFPIMAIGAAMGMNLHSGLESRPGLLFWLLVGGGLGLGLLIRRWVGGPWQSTSLTQTGSMAPGLSHTDKGPAPKAPS